MTNAADFMLRQLAADDHPFLFNSWLKSYRDAPAMAGIPNSLYFAGQHALIEKLLHRTGAVCLVACSKEDTAQIYGYAVGQILSPDTVALHWLYVKHPFRNFGIGKTLEAAVVRSATTVYFTHRVKPLERLLKTRSTYLYHPFILQDGP